MNLRQIHDWLDSWGTPTETLRVAARMGRAAVYALTLPGGGTVIGEWMDLKEDVEKAGYWPVIAGDWLPDPTPRAKASVTRVLRQAGRLDPHGVLAKLKAEMYPGAQQKLADGGVPHHAHGPFPRRPKPSAGFTLPWDISTRRPKDKVHLLLVPTRQSMDAVAWLGFGGFNACPEAEIHLCLLRHWRERYDLELACLDGHSLEMEVNNPPQTKHEALELAREHYFYCPDLVEQLTGTVEKLAAEFLQGCSWCFWWD